MGLSSESLLETDATACPRTDDAARRSAGSAPDRAAAGGGGCELVTELPFPSFSAASDWSLSSSMMRRRRGAGAAGWRERGGIKRGYGWGGWGLRGTD
jgi:hypothetical protein